MYYLEAKKLLFKNASMHLKQQLARSLEHSLRQITQQLQRVRSWNFFLHYYTVFVWSALNWRFVYAFSNICRNLTVLGIRNALQSVESSIQVQFLRLNAAMLYTLHYSYNTWEHRRNAFLALYLAQGWAICFRNTARPRASPVSLGTRVRAVSTINNYCVLHQL